MQTLQLHLDEGCESDKGYYQNLDIPLQNTCVWSDFDDLDRLQIYAQKESASFKIKTRMIVTICLQRTAVNYTT